MDFVGTFKMAFRRPYKPVFEKAGQVIAETGKTAYRGVKRLIWAITGELVAAWGTAMCWMVLPWVKLGLMELRTAGEEKGAPRMTHRCEVVIQVVALGVELVAVAWGAWKLVMLWKFGRG